MPFMGLDAGRFSDRLSEVRGERTPIAAALKGFAQGTRRYLVVSTVFGLIVAVIDTLALWWLGIPLPVLWGLLSFITNYIPHIGFLIGSIPPALLGLLQGGWTSMAAVIGVCSAINVVIQSIIPPKVVGDAVGLSTTMTFLSLAFRAWVLGPLGALLAVPLSLLSKALLVDADPNSRWLPPLLSGIPGSLLSGTHAGGRPEPDVDDPSAQAGPAVAGGT
jgi:AI-2 transport protein TqsA